MYIRDEIYLIKYIFILRYKGKGKPDAVLAEICWWSKTLFEEYEEQDEPMEVESAGEDDLNLFDDFVADSDDEDELDDKDEDGAAQPVEPTPPKRLNLRK